jgi:hypothetical protein
MKNFDARLRAVEAALQTHTPRHEFVVGWEDDETGLVTVGAQTMSKTDFDALDAGTRILVTYRQEADHQ